MKRVLGLLLILSMVATFLTLSDVSAMEAQDSAVIYDAQSGTWTLQTEQIEKKVKFADGSLVQSDYTDLETNYHYLQSAGGYTEFSIQVNGTEYRSDSGCWIYDSYQVSTIEQNCTQLTITIHNSQFTASCNQDIYYLSGNQYHSGVDNV